MKSFALGMILLSGLVFSGTSEATTYGRDRCTISTSDPYCWYTGYVVEEERCVQYGLFGRCRRWAVVQVCQHDGGPMVCN